MAFRHNSKTMKDEPMWGDVDKTALPRIAFADMGEEDKKSTWKYPHHWVYGGTEKDENGIWKDGTLYLHVGGLRAAIAAANGARSGEQAPQFVKDHLEQHKKALGASLQGEFAIEPSWFEKLSSAAITLEFEALQSEFTTFPSRRNMVSIVGPIFTYDNLFTVLGFGTSIEQIHRELDAASQAERILLFIDSPGGQLTGVADLAKRIRSISNEKEVIAFIYGLGASAAYWLASAATTIVASPTALVGSIGVILSTLKGSDEGIIYVTNSKSPNKRLNIEEEEDRAKVVKLLDDLAEVFISSVADFRAKEKQFVEDNFGRGGLVVAQEAVKVGMIDKITTIEEVMMEVDLKTELEKLKAEKSKLEFELFYNKLKNELKAQDAIADILPLYGKVEQQVIDNLVSRFNAMSKLIDDLGGKLSKTEVPVVNDDFETVKKFAAENKLTLIEAAVELERRKQCIKTQ